MPLDDESADLTDGGSGPKPVGRAGSTQALLLNALDLNDQSILDDQPDLADIGCP